MKKKIFLTVVMTFVFALVLTFAVSAASVHNENTVDYSATVTLDNGTVCNLFDSDKDALIWYLDSNGALQSVKAQDERVKFSKTGYDLEYLVNVQIDSDGNGTADIPNKNIVVLNLMDDDITGYGAYKKYNELFNGSDNKGANLEYCYLRLDTSIIAGKVFYSCKKLKYVNLESLTKLEIIGQRDVYNYGAAFAGCSSLFDGQLLDLSKTVLRAFSYGGLCGDGNFQSVPITGIKLPVTFNQISGNDFRNCTNLTTIYFGKKTTSISNDAFNGCTNLKEVFFVGEKADLEVMLGSISALSGATVISYADYNALADKSGKYAVYDYSSCAYNNGVHGTINATNACVGVCSVCGDTVVNHTDGNAAVSITYSNYALAGIKTTACQNVGCGHSETTEASALFTCLGYSAPEDGRGGIAIGFTVNNVAIAEYEEITGKTLKYGVFAVLQNRLGNNDVFADDGTVAEGVINAEITNYEFVAFELKIVGFTDERKDTKLAMGAYVAVTDGETTEYSYLQSGTPAANEKYCFVSYNDIVGNPSSDEETAQ